MHAIMKRCIALCLISLILLIGCSAATAARQQPTLLQVHRLALAHYPAYSPHAITDQQRVQQFYNAMQTLPHWTVPNPPGWRSCPHSGGFIIQ